MSGAPARGTVPRRQRRHHHHHHHHHHHQKHQKRVRDETPRDGTSDEPEEKRPKVNPIFLWASQREQRIVEVRCEDYDKRNRIKLTKTAQGWRSIPRTTCNVYTIATACKRATPSLVDSSPASSVSSNDEKENGKRHQERDQEIAPASATANPLRQKYATNGLLTGDGAGRKKRRYDEEENRRGYSYPLGTHKDSNWNSDSQAALDEIVAGESEEDNGEEQDREEQSATENRLSLKIKDKLSGRINLERLQKDKLFQPRVVLEQLHLSQLPESASKNVVCRARSKNEAKQTERNERDEENVAVDEAEDEEEEQEKEESGEKPGCRVNKAGIQDILNMIDATASPVLATDTPSADLPIDSTKTYEILGEKQPLERKVTEPNDINDRLKSKSASVYRTETIDQDDEIDDKLEVYEEKILDEDKLVLLSLKNNFETTLKSCKVAEADGGFVGQSRCRSTSLAFETPLETEEEAPDEPGELLKIDYKIDSSKILNALRNTPGLSISVASHAPEIGKNPIAPPRPPSKASSSSRSPDSQAECAEKLLLKNSHDYADNRLGRYSNSPRNLPGLSIVIPNYRYKNIAVANQLTTTTTTTTTISPGIKCRIESPESTVTFNKVDTYPGELNSLRDFPHEEGEENEEDDDCDSQVLEDLRRQKADSYDSADVDYYSRSGSRNNHEDRKTPPENAKGDSLWISSGRSSEAQAKCKHADLENLDLVLEELRSRGTVVSPQPSGIPCSPASRRPSSTYLERLLPSPPCSVSCSEDAKSELTLKSILASSCTESRDCERSKEGASIRSDQNVEVVSRPIHSSIDRNARRMYQRSFQERMNIHSQEARNSGRPLSSGDIHSTFYTTMAERAAPKRPMSAEWSTARPRNQIHCYQKLVSRTRNHFVNQQHDQHQVAYATSSSMDGKSLDPASQLRELIETVGHLIPDPLLVPRNYLPGLAAAPATEIPKLLASRPELRLPEALTRPDLLRDPDLLVISLAHLQHVLDHGEGPVSKSHGQSQHQPRHPVNKRSTDHANGNGGRADTIADRPKLSCKPIGTLMPAQPIDLSNGVRSRVSPCPPLLRVRSGLLKQEPEVSSTASSPDESQLWHPLFGSQKRQQQQQQQQQQPSPPQPQQQHASWHRTTLAS